MRRTVKTVPMRATVICDARGRILVAMATVANAGQENSNDQRPNPGLAGLKAGRGTKIYEIEVPAAVVGRDGAMPALIDDFTVKAARGGRGPAQLIARRGKRR